MSDILTLSISTKDTTWPDQIVFTVNGNDLRALVGSEGGGMTGPPLFLLAEQPDHFLGGPDRWQDPDEPFYELPAILGAAAGNQAAPPCSSASAFVTTTSSGLDFQLDRERGQLDLGPYLFDGRDYEAALASLRRGRHLTADRRW